MRQDKDMDDGPNATHDPWAHLPYALRVNSRCSTCKKETMCIQEPKLGGPLACIECYTGMSKEKFRGNMRNLARASVPKGRWVYYDQDTKTVKVTTERPKNYVGIYEKAPNRHQDRFSQETLPLVPKSGFNAEASRIRSNSGRSRSESEVESLVLDMFGDGAVKGGSDE